MTVARKYQIVEGAPGFVHCYSRCSQQQFLLGRDSATGFDYNHRREWIVDRIASAARTFAIDVYAYAILENHIHIVFYVDPERAFRWSDQEVADRWHEVYDWQRKTRGTPPPDASMIPEDKLAKNRERLGSVSWVMKSIKEPISRWANAESGKKGNFWEGRFGSTALVDDAAVVTGMAYVDLNVIRAAMADSLEASDFTSIQVRLKDFDWMRGHGSAENQERNNPDNSESRNNTRRPLNPLFVVPTAECASNVAVSLDEYVALLELKIHPNGPGSAAARETIFEKLGCDPEIWVNLVDQLQKVFRVAIGGPTAVKQYFENLGRKNVIDRSASQFFKRPEDPA